MKTKTFITTSIAYLNAEPHIGFLLELVAADVLVRYHELRGEEVFFLTGTDDHGIKVAQAAEAAGKTPAKFTDELAAKFEQAVKDFNISNDFFIRTTDPGHIKFVQNTWEKLAAAGVLEKRSYAGFYCSGCEAFKTEREITDGKCVIHERELEKVEEENWFLVGIKKHESRIKEWVESSVYPESRRQEVINTLESGAFDAVSVSRPKEKLSWGIEVPGDPTQTMYVWVDALLNYLSAIELSGRKVEEWWPADIQLIGKDILKFHTIIWPSLLLTLGYELPKKLLVHGFVNVEGKKMSKSLGNVITPAALKERYGVDGTRYLLLRQLNFYDDSNFSWAEFDALYNGELANGLGNLVARVIGLAKKAGVTLPSEYDQHTPSQNVFDFHHELEEANALIGECDKAVTDSKLWEETETKKETLLAIAQKIYRISLYVEPFIPNAAKEIRRQLTELDPKPLFPRLS